MAKNEHAYEVHGDEFFDGTGKLALSRGGDEGADVGAGGLTNAHENNESQHVQGSNEVRYFEGNDAYFFNEKEKQGPSG